MTSFPNDEENIEQRIKKHYEDDDEEDNSIEDGDEADDHDDDEEEGDGEEETDNGETGGDTENIEIDPCNKLRKEAISDLNSAYEEEVQENLRQGLQKDDAEVQASHRLLPVYRKKLRHLYLQYLGGTTTWKLIQCTCTKRLWKHYVSLWKTMRWIIQRL